MNRRSLQVAAWLPCLVLLLVPTVGNAAPLLTRAGSFWFEVLVNDSPAPSYFHRGESYLLGQKGERYTLRVHNDTGRRVEAVVTVDGLDVLDGKTGALAKRGYIVPAWGYVDIEGWRLSSSEVAAFRFSSVASSYAGQTGRARDVGVIGVAVFKERIYIPPQPVYVPYPNPPRSDDYYDRDRRYSRSAPSAAEGKGGGAASGDSVARGHSARERSQAPAATTSPPRSSASSKMASGPVARPTPPREERPGLATAFGERTASAVRQTTFSRANHYHPNAVLGARYNDQPGLIAMGVDISYVGCCHPDPYLRQSATPFPASEPRYAAPPSGWPY